MCQKCLRVSRNFVPGDTFFLVDEKAPQNSWGIGKCLQSVLDEEGLVYWVCVNIKTSELDRFITKVCLLHDAEGFEAVVKTGLLRVCQALATSDIRREKVQHML